MPDAAALLLACAVASTWMASLVWVMQLLVYPGFASIAPERWRSHHRRHQALVTVLVFPPMVVELVAPIALLTVARPAEVAPLVVWGLAIGSVATWVLTALVSAPLHGRLERGYDPQLQRRLVRTNWPRTVLWSGLAALAVLAVATEVGVRA
jgi:uncharacterized membrane protein